LILEIGMHALAAISAERLLALLIIDILGFYITVVNNGVVIFVIFAVVVTVLAAAIFVVSVI